MAFIQEPPRLGNTYATDKLLASLVDRSFAGDERAGVHERLGALGGLAGGPLYQLQLADRENEPVHTPWDAWGNRIDHIEVSPLWKQAARLAAEHGLVATGYDRAQGVDRDRAGAGAGRDPGAGPGGDRRDRGRRDDRRGAVVARRRPAAQPGVGAEGADHDRGAAHAEPDMYYAYFHSSRIPDKDHPDDTNRWRYANPEVDRLLTAGRSELDRAVRVELYAQAQAILLDEMPIVPLWHEDNVAVVNRAVVGFQVLPSARWSSFAQASKR